MSTTPGRELVKAGEVVDAEIVTDEEWSALTTQRELAAARARVYRRDVVVVARTAKTIATHQHTVSTGRAILRNATHVVVGAMVVAKRVWEARTNTRYERVMRAAEAMGDWDRLEKWEALGEKARERRHRRAMQWIAAPMELAKGLAVGGLTLAIALLMLGILLFAGSKDPADLLGPIRALIDLVTWVAWAVAIVWGPLVLAVPWLVVLALWHVGRKSGATPAWLAPTTSRQGGEEITPSLVVVAFRDLGITELRKRITAMGDAGAGMLSPIRIAGCGVEVDVTPPRGATASSKILALHERLAENLGRRPYEVHLSLPSAGTIRVWAADSGALDEPIGPSPMVLDDAVTSSYERGKAPWGENLRGDPLGMSLYQRHLLITGGSNQGKTRAMLALALWLAQDKDPEFWIADLKGMNDKTGRSDWAPMQELATVFIAGPTDDHVIAATEMLENAVTEMQRRLTTGGPWKPLIVICDEAQQAFICPEIGPDGRPYGGKKATSRYFMAARKLHNQGRVVDVLLWQGTQDPTDQNLPELVRNGAHIRASLAVPTAAKSAMALGEKAVLAGAAPHLLRPGLDKGTLVVAGDGAPLEPGQASVTVRTHYIDDEAAQELADRALARRAPRTVDPAEVRDLLDDVAEALGTDEMVRAKDVAVRLRKLAPGYRDYAHLDGRQLADLLGREGVEVRSKDGYPMVRTNRVQRAIADRLEDE